MSQARRLLFGALLVTMGASAGPAASNDQAVEEFRRGLSLRCPGRHLANLDSVRRDAIIAAFDARFPPPSAPEMEEGATGVCVDVYVRSCDYIHALHRAARLKKMAALVSMACQSGYACTTLMGECRKVSK